MYGDFEDRVFYSRPPPVVTLDTIIIAVCGSSDWSDNASLKIDSCSISNLFLFYNLLFGTAKQQHSMVCVNPGKALTTTSSLLMAIRYQETEELYSTNP